MALIACRLHNICILIILYCRKWLINVVVQNIEYYVFAGRDYNSEPGDKVSWKIQDIIKLILRNVLF